MDKRDVQNGIYKSWSFTEKALLGETFSTPRPLEVDEVWRDLLLDPSSTYEQVYINGLANQRYNFLLSDYAFFQFSIGQHDHVRYAYYPNPYIGNETDAKNFRKRQELLRADLISAEDYLLLNEKTAARGRVPMFRYENAPSQWRELCHPCSHLHIGFHSENRWALDRLLTPLAFTMLIAKQYYPSAWSTAGREDGKIGGNCFEEDLIAEKKTCYLIGEELFSCNERLSFAFC